MSANWEYGGFYKNYDMQGVIDLPFKSKVKVCDWTLELPEFMREADTLFIDPPWNKGNMNSFYTKADLPHKEIDFMKFTDILFNRIDEIAPEVLFIEMGKEYLWKCFKECRERYKYVTFYNSTYYHKSDNKCYVIHAANDSRRRRYKDLEDLDEEDIIKWICAHHDYECIGDLCMGTGLVGKHAHLNGKRFVGTELNKKRLARLINYIESRVGNNL